MASVRAWQWPGASWSMQWTTGTMCVDDSLKDQAQWLLGCSLSQRALVFCLRITGHQKTGLVLALPSEGRDIWLICPTSQSHDAYASAGQKYSQQASWMALEPGASSRPVVVPRRVADWKWLLMASRSSTWALRLGRHLCVGPTPAGITEWPWNCRRLKTSMKPEKGWLVASSPWSRERHLTV